jgi:hypothetical protein
MQSIKESVACVTSINYVISEHLIFKKVEEKDRAHNVPQVMIFMPLLNPKIWVQ